MLKASLHKIVRHVRRSLFTENSEQRGVLLDSGLFDPVWYLETYPDVKASGADPLDHYLAHGWREGRSPGPTFDTSFYLTTYPDVANAAIEPVFHYVRHGAGEGRRMSAAANPGEATSLQNEMPKPHPVATVAQLEADEFFFWVGQRIKGRHVVFLGGPSQQNIERLIGLMLNGAASARLLTSEITPAHDKLFRYVVEKMALPVALKQKLSGLEPLERVRNGYGIWSAQNAAEAWFALSYLGDPEIVNKVGPVDVFVTTDIAQLDVEPMRLMQAIHAIAPKEWFSEFPVTPAGTIEVEGSKVSFTPETLLYAGSCLPQERRALFQAWHRRGVELTQFVRIKGNLTPASASAAGMDGVWWWFWGERALAALCARAGFSLDESQPLPTRPMQACRLVFKSLRQAD